MVHFDLVQNRLNGIEEELSRVREFVPEIEQYLLRVISTNGNRQLGG